MYCLIFKAVRTPATTTKKVTAYFFTSAFSIIFFTELNGLVCLQLITELIAESNLETVLYILLICRQLHNTTFSGVVKSVVTILKNNQPLCDLQRIDTLSVG